MDSQIHLASYMNPQKLEKLLNGIQANDETALSELYDAYANAVFSVAIHIMQHTQDAEEVTQDVFLRLWNKSETFDPNKGTFITWILTITRRIAIDHQRKRTRMIDALKPMSLDEHPYLWETIAGKETLNDLQQSLLSALSELRPEYREAIQLAYLGGMTHVEVASKLERPVGTVKSHIRMGMEKLRAIWMSKEIEGSNKRNNE